MCVPCMSSIYTYIQTRTRSLVCVFMFWNCLACPLMLEHHVETQLFLHVRGNSAEGEVDDIRAGEGCTVRDAPVVLSNQCVEALSPPQDQRRRHAFMAKRDCVGERFVGDESRRPFGAHRGCRPHPLGRGSIGIGVCGVPLFWCLEFVELICGIWNGWNISGPRTSNVLGRSRDQKPEIRQPEINQKI